MLRFVCYITYIFTACVYIILIRMAKQNLSSELANNRHTVCILIHTCALNVYKCICQCVHPNNTNAHTFKLFHEHTGTGTSTRTSSRTRTVRPIPIKVPKLMIIFHFEFLLIYAEMIYDDYCLTLCELPFLFWKFQTISYCSFCRSLLFYNQTKYAENHFIIGQIDENSAGINWNNRYVLKIKKSHVFVHEYDIVYCCLTIIIFKYYKNILYYSFSLYVFRLFSHHLSFAFSSPLSFSPSLSLSLQFLPLFYWYCVNIIWWII